MMNARRVRSGTLIAVAAGALASPALASITTFEHTGAIVDWVVPQSGIYRFTAVGGQGGGITASGGLLSADGGRGARVAGTMTLTAGTTLRIAVAGGGSLGGDSGPGWGGGGGGGSFVVGPGDTPLFVAGGGGGATFTVGFGFALSGDNARLGTTAGSDVLSPVPIGQGGRHSRFQYEGVRVYGDATGGAGFYGDSQGAPSTPFLPEVPVARGWSSLAPASGGGFGGGGGGWNDTTLTLIYQPGSVGIGAGGGGYTGGSGGIFAIEGEELWSLTGGFGGASFASSLATDALFEVASDRTGNGQVAIEFLAVPTPGAAALLGLAGVIAAGGRRRR